MRRNRRLHQQAPCSRRWSDALSPVCVEPRTASSSLSAGSFICSNESSPPAAIAPYRTIDKLYCYVLACRARHMIEL